jgi:hypothetical protein
MVNTLNWHPAMIQLLVNFLNFQALNTPPEVYWALSGIWFLLLLAGVLSVLGRRCAWWAKAFWLLVVVGLPIVGLFLYCLYCLVAADYAFLKMFGLHKQTAAHLRAAAPTRK